MPAPGVPHLVEAIQEKEGAPFLESPLKQGSERDPDLPFLLVIARDEIIERDISSLFGQGVGIGSQGEEDGEPAAQPERFALAGGERQGQDLEEGSLARAGISQQDQTVVLLEEI